MSQQLLCRLASIQPVHGQPWVAGLYREKETHMETGQGSDPLTRLCDSLCQTLHSNLELKFQEQCGKSGENSNEIMKH